MMIGYIFNYFCIVLTICMRKYAHFAALIRNFNGFIIIRGNPTIVRINWYVKINNESVSDRRVCIVLYANVRGH